MNNDFWIHFHQYNHEHVYTYQLFIIPCDYNARVLKLRIEPFFFKSQIIVLGHKSFFTFSYTHTDIYIYIYIYIYIKVCIIYSCVFVFYALPFLFIDLFILDMNLCL